MLRWFGALFLTLFSAQLWAAQCSAVYPGAVQSNFAGGRLTINSNGRILNSPTSQLPFDNGTINGSGNSCGSVDCTVTGSSAAEFNLPNFPSNSVLDGSSYSYSSNRVLGQGSYFSDRFRHITVNGGTTSFSNNYTTYYLRSLQINNSGRVDFKPGTYWIRNLTLNSSARINVVGSGTVKIYARNVNLNSNSVLDGINGNAKLLLTVYNNMHANSDAQAEGAFYVYNRLNVDSNASITGAVSTYDLTINSNGRITYDSNALSQLDFGSLCTGSVGGNSTVTRYQMEQTGWSGSGSILDTSGNNNNATPVGNVTPEYPDPQKSCKAASIPANNSYSSRDAINTDVDINTLGNQGSIAFWYRSKQNWAQVNTSKVLLDATQSNNAEFTLFHSQSRRLFLYISESDGDTAVYSTNNTFSFTSSDWVHIAVTWDADNNNVKIYVNGSSQALSEQNNVALDEGLANISTLYIGDNRSTSNIVTTGHSADGYIDEVHMYDYILTSAQVTTVSNSVTTCNIPEPTPIAKYELSQISFSGNNSILDTSGNNNHASPVGSLASVLPSPQKSCRAADVPYNNTASSSAINTGLDLDSDIGSKGTIAFWYKSDNAWANSNNRKLIDASNYTGSLLSSKAFYGTLTAAGRIEFGLEGSADNDLVVQTPVQSFAANQWVHIVFTWNVATQTLEIYLNGVKQTLSFISNQGVTAPLIDLDTLYIGDNRDSYDSFQNNTNGSADGVFDEIYIYNGVISSSTVNTIKDAVTLCACSINGLTGSYYSGYTNSSAAFPTGTPTLSRVDSNVAFNWGGGSPGGSVGSNDFAVVWQGTVQAPVTGSITFSTYTDDGVRLWVDGQLLIDDWRDKSPHRVTASPVSLVAGQQYAIRMEYYENGGGAVAQLEWQYSGQARQPIPSQYLFACNGPVVSSVALQCNVYDKFVVNFDVIGNATISTAELENLSRYVLKDNGGNTINLSSASAQSSNKAVELTPSTSLSQDAQYTLTVTDLEDTAGNKVAPNPTNFQFTAAAMGLTGYYYTGYNYNNPFPTGVATLTRTDSIVDFNWGTGSPGGGVSSNNFAVAWVGEIVAPVTGNYTFSTVTDDGTRLFIDENNNNTYETSGANNEKIIEHWQLQSATRRTATRTVYLTAGTRYDIRMEYFENSGDASAQLEWQYPGQNRQVVPRQYLRPVCQSTQVDHYRLEHPANGYTCADTQVTIKACTNASCTSLYNQPASLNLTTDNGSWLAGTSINFTGSTNKLLRNTTHNSVSTIGATSPSPNAAVRCYTGGTQSNCKITYTSTGLTVSWQNDTDPVTQIPVQVSQTAFNQKLVVKTSNLASCGTALQGRQLQVAVECTNPGTCNNNMFRVSGTQTGNPTNFYTLPSLTFDANGKVEIPANLLKYDDAGQIRLKFRDIDPGSSNLSRAEGTSNNFVVKPTEIKISHTANSPEIAGNNFNLLLTAVGAEGNTTPNYQSQQLDIALEKQTPTTPGSLSYKGQINVSYTNSSNQAANFNMSVADNLTFPGTSKFITQPKFTNGVATLQTNYTEVGIIRFDFRDRNYLTQGTVDANDGGLNFVPSHFTLEESSVTIPTCNSRNYRYIGHDFTHTTSLTLMARNQLGAATRYYDSSGATGSVFGFSSSNLFANRQYLDENNLDLTTAPKPQINTGTAGVIADNDNFDGDFIIAFNQDRFGRDKTLTPVVPQTTPADINNANSTYEIRFTIPAADFTAAEANNRGFSTTNLNDGFDALTLSNITTGVELRDGRLVLENAFGQKNTNLPVPIIAQYYNANEAWVTNTDDSCTTYSSTNSINITPQNAGDPVITQLQTFAGLRNLVNGIPQAPVNGFVLVAPNQNEVVNLEWQNIPAYLKFNWDNTGGLDNPRAVATFGDFRGNDKIIHWREVFNE